MRSPVNSPMTRPDRQPDAGRLLPQRFAALARGRHLIRPGDQILVALSGGPDSVALLALLAELASTWALELAACHVHHGLRGREADEDADFVATLCRTLEIPIRIEHLARAASPRTRARQSLQEWAREARYAALRRVADDLGMVKIALGHTADDQAETVLLWMLRGAGLTGLAGIPPTREGRIIRPLLGFRRRDLIRYVKEKGLTYRTDSSNAKSVYLRNRIRQEVLPVLKAINPAIVETLCRQAELLRADERWMSEQAADCLARLIEEGHGRISLRREDFRRLPLALQRRAVRGLLRQLSPSGRWPTFRTVSAVHRLVTRARSGSTVTLSRLRVVREYDTIAFERRDPQDERRREDAARSVVGPGGLHLAVPATVTWPLTGQTIRVRWGRRMPAGGKGRSPRTAAFDADRFTPDLRLRSWSPGDVFQPAGMKGHRKKLQDYFSDLKVPRAERHQIPLLVAPEGILWILGYRQDERFCATAGTRRVLIADVRP